MQKKVRIKSNSIQNAKEITCMQKRVKKKKKKKKGEARALRVFACAIKTIKTEVDTMRHQLL